MGNIRKRRIRLLRTVLFFTLIPAALLFGDAGGANSSTFYNEVVKELILPGAGYLLLMAGLALRLWSTLHVGRRKSEELVIDGPYSICRNPLYVGTFLIGAGGGLAFGSFLAPAVVLVVLVPVHVLTVRGEEKRLEELFGPRYADYRASTPAYNILNWRGYRSAEFVRVSGWAVRRASLEAAAVLLIPLAGRLVYELHELHALPTLAPLP